MIKDILAYFRKTWNCYISFTFFLAGIKITNTPADCSIKLMSTNYKRNAQVLRGLKFYKVVTYLTHSFPSYLPAYYYPVMDFLFY